VGVPLVTIDAHDGRIKDEIAIAKIEIAAAPADATHGLLTVTLAIDRPTNVATKTITKYGNNFLII
jgi:hypothetical protein